MPPARKRKAAETEQGEKRGYPPGFDVRDKDQVIRLLVERGLITVKSFKKMSSVSNLHGISPPEATIVPLIMEDPQSKKDLLEKIDKIAALSINDFWKLFSHMDEAELNKFKEDVSALVTENHSDLKNNIGMLGHEDIFEYFISACHALGLFSLPEERFDNTRTTQNRVSVISWDTFHYFLTVNTDTGFLDYDPFNQSNDFFSKQLDEDFKASRENRLHRLISHAYSQICAWSARGGSEKAVFTETAPQEELDMAGVDLLLAAAQTKPGEVPSIEPVHESTAPALDQPPPPDHVVEVSSIEPVPESTAPALDQPPPSDQVVEVPKTFMDMIASRAVLTSRKDPEQDRQIKDIAPLFQEPTAEAKTRFGVINGLRQHRDSDTETSLMETFRDRVNEKQVKAAVEAMQLIMEPTVATAFLSSYPGFGKTRAALLIASMLFEKFPNGIVVVFMAYQLMQQWKMEIETMFGDNVHVQTFTEAGIRGAELLDVDPMEKPQFLIMPISLFDDMPAGIEVCGLLEGCEAVCAVFTDEIDVRGRKANQFTYALGQTICRMQWFKKTIRVVHISGTPAHEAENCESLCKISGVRPPGGYLSFWKGPDSRVIIQSLMVGAESSSVHSKVPPFAAYAMKVPLDLDNPLAASHRAQLHGNGQDDCGKFTYATRLAEEWCKKKQGSAMVVFENKNGLCTIAEKLKGVLGDENVILITGDIAERERAFLLERAKTEPNRVILITPQLGGSGLNLQSVTLIVTVPFYSEHLEEQLIARAYRNGQQKTVLVLFLVCGKTEDGCMKRQREKADSVSFLYPPEKTVKNMGKFSNYETMTFEQVPVFLHTAYYLAENGMACPGTCFGVYPRSMIGNNDELSTSACRKALTRLPG